VGVTLTLLAMLGVAPAEVGAPDADAAMSAYVAAMRARDRRRAAALLCRDGRVHYLNTLERPYRRASIDCRRAEDLDELLFGDDGFRDYVMMAGRRAWRRRGGYLYVPPYATGDEIHVRWRREGDRLFIEELAMPSG
jgi:hypothetical protein